MENNSYIYFKFIILVLKLIKNKKYMQENSSVFLKIHKNWELYGEKFIISSKNS